MCVCVCACVCVYVRARMRVRVFVRALMVNIFSAEKCAAPNFLHVSEVSLTRPGFSRVRLDRRNVKEVRGLVKLDWEWDKPFHGKPPPPPSPPTRRF
jgi:hypothetical protein